MTAYLPLIALITYPIIAMIVVGKSSLVTIKKTAGILFGINMATIWGALLHLYTIWPGVNTFLMTLVYFNVCLVIGAAFLHKNSITKMTGFLLMIMVFGLGFFMAWIGWRGSGFAATNGQKEIEQLQDGITVEHTPIGSNIVKYRGLKVEVYKQVEKFPVLKLRVAKRSYFDTILPYFKPLVTTYTAPEKMVILSCDSFTDTLRWEK